MIRTIKPKSILVLLNPVLISVISISCQETTELYCLLFYEIFSLFSKAVKGHQTEYTRSTKCVLT